MCYHYNLVPTVYKFCRELIDVAFHSPRLGEEEVADHRNVVRHFVLLAKYPLGL